MCECCDEAREAPHQYRMFADGCLHCAARRIQYLQRTLRLGATNTQARCRTALQQAMALGLPAICMDWGGPQLLVEHEKTGYLIEPTTVEQITDKMARQ